MLRWWEKFRRLCVSEAKVSGKHNISNQLTYHTTAILFRPVRCSKPPGLSQVLLVEDATSTVLSPPLLLAWALLRPGSISVDPVMFMSVVVVNS